MKDKAQLAKVRSTSAQMAVVSYTCMYVVRLNALGDSRTGILPIWFFHYRLLYSTTKNGC